MGPRPNRALGTTETRQEAARRRGSEENRNAAKKATFRKGGKPEADHDDHEPDNGGSEKAFAEPIVDAPGE